MIASRKALIVIAFFVGAVLTVSSSGGVASAQTISVTAANPSSGEQGTLSLDVTITGRGFKNDAKATFYKTRTTDPAGLTVKSTRYVSSTQLVANIEIADTAALSSFDIQVRNADGRTGKGTELFNVLQKKLPPPPSAPLKLGAGLNLVVATNQSTAQIRAFPLTAPVAESWAETRPNVAKGLTLADVDGDRQNELVFPGLCVDSNNVYHGYLIAYKQGVAGEVYNGGCDPLQRVETNGMAPFQTSITGHDLDNDGTDEIVLRTEDALAVFKLAAGKWAGSSLHFRDLNLQPPFASLDLVQGRSLAVGDVDSDGSAELVVVVDYYDYSSGTGACRSYVTVFSSTLQVEASIALQEIGVPEFCVNYKDGLALADTDGNGVLEIWCAGWTNNATITQYRQRMFSFVVDGGSPTLRKVGSWDFGWTTTLGPSISAGRVAGDAGDAILRWRLPEGSQFVLVYRPTVDASGSTVLGIPTTITSDYGVSAVNVAEGQVILFGMQPSTPKVKGRPGELLGFYMESLTWDGSAFAKGVFYSLRDGSTFGDVAVGLATK
jgi:hypothetical protein